MIKKLIFALVLAATASTVNSQTVTDTSSAVEYNKWSIEFAGGLNKPMRPLTAGYRTAVASSYVADFGVRYMFNNKFPSFTFCKIAIGNIGCIDNRFQG